MRCEKCGKALSNTIVRVNGTVLCEDCAREMGMPVGDPLGGAFRLLDNDLTTFFPPIMREHLEFSPTRSQIKCPKCGTTLKEFESTGTLGCIECYNVFNESIMRLLMRLQATTNYSGRAPGIASENKITSREVNVDNISSKQESESQDQVKDVATSESKLLKFANADIGMLTNEDLNDAIKLAVENEDYLLAAKFRDELRSREGN